LSASKNKFARDTLPYLSAPKMSLFNEMPGSAFNTQVLITTLITVVSVLIGMYFGSRLSSEKSQPLPKIIVRCPSEISYILAKIQEGSLICSETEKLEFISTLIELMDEQNHPDADILYYIASEVANKRHLSQIYEVWLTLAYRRLAVTPNERLPEAWFVEPTAVPATEEELDLSDISESSTDDYQEISEAVPLISPIQQIPDFEDNLNQAQIYSTQSNLLDIDTSLPEEVGLPAERSVL
jgi:hypothetical protein